MMQCQNNACKYDVKHILKSETEKLKENIKQLETELEATKHELVLQKPAADLILKARSYLRQKLNTSIMDDAEKESFNLEIQGV